MDKNFIKENIKDKNTMKKCLKEKYHLGHFQAQIVVKHFEKILKMNFIKNNNGKPNSELYYKLSKK